MNTALSIGIIGGADGPTAVFVTGLNPWGFLLAVAGAAAAGWLLYRKFRKK